MSTSAKIAAHRVHRAYYAIVEGHMKEQSGFVDAPIGRHPADRKKKTGRTAYAPAKSAEIY